MAKQLTLPTKSGYYWVLIEGYDEPTPCLFSVLGKNENEDDACFLPGGMGDSSSNGVYLDEKIGPEIIVPKF